MSVRGRPFEPGNKSGRGRPLGSRNKKNKAQEVLDTYSVSLIKKASLEALKGNVRLLEVLVGYVLPKPTASPVHIGAIGTDTQAELALASAKVVKQVATGKITPDQGQQVASVIQGHMRVLGAGGVDKQDDASPFEVHIQKESPAGQEQAVEKPESAQKELACEELN